MTLMSLTAITFWVGATCAGQPSANTPGHSLTTLLGMSPGRTAQCNIAAMNLACAQDLPGSESLDVQRILSTLDEWATAVERETQRLFNQFQRQPDQFNHSEAYFRMLVLTTVLQQDFRVKYNPQRIESPTTPMANDTFFGDARDVFLLGLLSDRRMGTCSSLPVLTVAIGRHLGYPLKLVSAKGHLFVRWESQDGKERFNIEATARGLVTHTDEYYRRWPAVISDQELKTCRYLQSLEPAEELAVFLSIRGHVLESARRWSEARQAYARASELVPDSLLYRQELARVVERADAKTTAHDSVATSNPRGIP